jgi:uncharacterized protein YciI
LRTPPITVALVTLAYAAAAQTPAPAASPSPAPSRLYAVVVRTGPSWDPAKAPAEQTHFREHSANIRRLGAEGALALGGRMGDLGLLLVRAASEAEARASFDRDPSVAAGTFRLEVHEWRTFAPGCVDAASPAPRASPR